MKRLFFSYVALFAQNSHPYWVILALGLVPFTEAQTGFRFTGFSAIMVAVSAALSGKYQQKVRFLGQHPLVGVWPFYFLVVLLGFLWSQNLQEAGIVLELRILCLSLPLALWAMPSWSKSFWSKVWILLVIVALGNSLFSFRYGIDFFIEGAYHASPDLPKPYTLHRNYFALFNLSISMLALFHFRKRRASFGLWLSVFTLLFFLAYNYMARAKGPVAAALVAGVLVLFFYLLREKRWLPLALLLALLFGLLGYILRTQPEWVRMAGKVARLEYLGDPAGRGYDWRYSVDSRTQIWKFSTYVWQEPGVPWHGVGTGDLKDRLSHYYCQANAYWCEKKFNPHNQFLMMALRWGLPLTLLLVFGLFLWPAYLSIQNRDWAFLFVLCLSFLAFQFECYLNREAGLLFFVLIWSLRTRALIRA